MRQPIPRLIPTSASSLPRPSPRRQEGGRLHRGRRMRIRPWRPMVGAHGRAESARRDGRHAGLGTGAHTHARAYTPQAGAPGGLAANRAGRWWRMPEEKRVGRSPINGRREQKPAMRAQGCWGAVRGARAGGTRPRWHVGAMAPGCRAHSARGRRKAGGRGSMRVPWRAGAVRGAREEGARPGGIGALALVPCAGGWRGGRSPRRER